jgi:flavin-binding protein dodecin
MDANVYRVTEIVGSSDQGIDHAVKTAVQRAGKTLRHLEWFEVTSIRGSLSTDGAPTVQVTLKVGFRIEDPDDTAG